MKSKLAVPRLSSKEATILGILLQSPHDEMFGLQILTCSDGLLKRGTIYVTLQRMEEKKLIKSKQEARQIPEIGIPRRLYSVTGLGAKAFDQYKEAHRKLSRLISVGVSS